MKKALLLALALAAVKATAQESYTVPVSAADVLVVMSNIDDANGKLCDRYALARPCTQSAVCAAAVAQGTTVPGGAACTPAQARQANVRIFDSSAFAGRQEFFLLRILAPAAQAFVSVPPAELQCRTFKVAGPAKRKAMCNAADLPDDCILCQ